MRFRFCQLCGVGLSHPERNKHGLCRSCLFKVQRVQKSFKVRYPFRELG